MDYISLEKQQYYKPCAALVEEMGYWLVDLKIQHQKSTVHIEAVIAPKDSSVSLGVKDCESVHRSLLPKLEELLGTTDTYMELTSPGLERNIKNAAEFKFFAGREIRVWDRTVTDWVGGILVSSDEKSVTLETKSEEGSAVQKTVSLENIAKAKFIHI